jgi:hypothetical protein
MLIVILIAYRITLSTESSKKLLFRKILKIFAMMLPLIAHGFFITLKCYTISPT